MIEVTFRSLSRAPRVWSAIFDLGGDVENAECALEVAFKHNAEIIGSVPAKEVVK